MADDFDEVRMAASPGLCGPLKTPMLDCWFTGLMGALKNSHAGWMADWGLQVP